MAASRTSTHHSVAEIPESLWLTTDDIPHDTSWGLWDSEHSSMRGSFRGNEDEDSAPLLQPERLRGCHERVQREPVRLRIGQSALRTQRQRGSQSLDDDHRPKLWEGTPLPACLGVPQQQQPREQHGGLKGWLRTLFIRTPRDSEEADTEPLRSTAENGGVSPKRRGQLRGSKGLLRKQGGAKGEGSRGGWLGQPAQQPPPRGQVAFQSCLRPGLGVFGLSMKRTRRRRRTMY